MHLFLAQAAEEESTGGLIDVVPGLMIWTLICFALTFFVLRRFAFGPIQKTIDERRDRIRAAVDEADKAREEARALLEQHRQLIADAKGEAADILADARKVADAQFERVKEESEAERARRLEETKRQIDAETKRSLDLIRSEVADLTLEATARVTGKVLDAEDQRRLIDEAIAELDFSALEKEQGRSGRRAAHVCPRALPGGAGGEPGRCRVGRSRGARPRDGRSAGAARVPAATRRSSRPGRARCSSSSLPAPTSSYGTSSASSRRRAAPASCPRSAQSSTRSSPGHRTGCPSS